MLAAIVLGVCIVVYGIDGKTITAENVSRNDMTIIISRNCNC